MKEFESSVSPKGQITLPIEVRRRWRLKAKDRVAICVDGDRVTIAPAGSPLDAMYQSVPALSPPRTWREITELAAEEHAQHVATEGLPDR
jgi:AbrB family looped-hinge helix DNA binding protein